MVNSQRKGKRFEREVAKKLSEFYGLPFRRVPMSGGFGTMGATRREFRGDIYCDSPKCGIWQKIVVECKVTKQKINLSDIFREKSLLWQWVEQAKREAEGQDWVLIFKDGTRKLYAVSQKKHPIGKAASAYIVVGSYYLWKLDL